jgi:hypothetical protein
VQAQHAAPESLIPERIKAENLPSLAHQLISIILRRIVRSSLTFRPALQRHQENYWEYNSTNHSGAKKYTSPHLRTPFGHVTWIYSNERFLVRRKSGTLNFVDAIFHQPTQQQRSQVSQKSSLQRALRFTRA